MAQLDQRSQLALQSYLRAQPRGLSAAKEWFSKYNTVLEHAMTTIHPCDSRTAYHGTVQALWPLQLYTRPLWYTAVELYNYCMICVQYCTELPRSAHVSF